MSDPIAAALSVARKIRKPKQTVSEPQRNAFPGIYEDPRVIAEEAASRVAPESLAMKRLFGVTREELYEMGAGRKGSAEPKINTKPGATGSVAADRLMNPKNARRLQDILHEAGQHRGLQRGMDAWYNMDPVLERLKSLVGPEKAPAHYSRLNTMIGLMSPGSEVNTEIDRGLAAHHLFHQGKIDQFIEKGGLPEGKRGPDFPQEIARMKGHPYHSTSQAGPLKKYLERGEITSDAPKVPLYVQASEAHETGNQTRLPVPDAHFTRALGMSDTRGGESAPGASMKMAEYQPVGPWFREKVAKPVGLEAVPAQARLWGAASGQTGVTTKIGAPKLELLANHIMAVAKHHGIQPETARDLVLTGKIYFRGGRVERAAGGPIRAYHGSPHDFDQFDVSKVGTGEGAQSYGHGLYFAGNEDTARYYRDALTNHEDVPLHFDGKPIDTPWNADIRERWPEHFEGKSQREQDALEEALGNLSQVNQERDIPNALGNMTPAARLAYTRHIKGKISKPDYGKGHMYEAKLNVNPDHLLDWDRPISEQHPHVRRAVNKLLEEKYGPSDVDRFGSRTGAAMQHILQDKAVADRLRDLGVPGVKYLDQGSRDSAAGSHNYVMFHHDPVEVTRKYAKGGAVNVEPTEAQKMVGNYRKAKISFQGLPISIENPKGSIRRGPGWQVKVPYDYGYIRGTQGADGDHVDVCIGPDPASDSVFVVDQQDHRTGAFDEHKAMLGYRSKAEAVADYHRGFSDGKGLARMKSIVRMTMPEFKVWLRHCDTKKPVRGQGHIERALAQTPVYAATQTSATETKK